MIDDVNKLDLEASIEVDCQVMEGYRNDEGRHFWKLRFARHLQ